MNLEFYNIFTTHSRTHEENLKLNALLLELQNKFDDPHSVKTKEDWKLWNQTYSQQRHADSYKTQDFMKGILKYKSLIKNGSDITGILDFIKNSNFYLCPYFREFYIRHSIRTSDVSQKVSEDLFWNLSYKYDEIITWDAEQKELLGMLLTYILYVIYIDDEDELLNRVKSINWMSKLLNSSHNFKAQKNELKKSVNQQSYFVCGQSFVLRNFLFKVADECKDDHDMEVSIRKILYQIKDDEFFSFLIKIINSREYTALDLSEPYMFNYLNLRNIISAIHIRQEKNEIRKILYEFKGWIPFKFLFVGSELFIGFPEIKVFEEWQHLLNLFHENNKIHSQYNFCLDPNSENSFSKSILLKEGEDKFYAYIYFRLIEALSKRLINNLEHNLWLDLHYLSDKSISKFDKNLPLYFGGLNFYRDLSNYGIIIFNLPIDRWVATWIKQNYLLIESSKKSGTSIKFKNRLGHRMRDNKQNEVYFLRLKYIIDFKVARDLMQFVDYLLYFEPHTHQQQLTYWSELYTYIFEQSIRFTEEKIFKFNTDLLHDLLRIGSILNEKRGFFLFSNLWKAKGIPKLFSKGSYINLIECTKESKYSNNLLEHHKSLKGKFNKNFNPVLGGSSSFILSKYDLKLQNFIAYFRRVELDYIVKSIASNKKKKLLSITLVRWIEFEELYPKTEEKLLNYKELEQGFMKAYKNLPLNFARQNADYEKKKYLIKYKYLSLVNTSKNFYILWSIANDSSLNSIQEGCPEYAFNLLGTYDTYFKLDVHLNLVKLKQLKEESKLWIFDRYLINFEKNYPEIYEYYKCIEDEQIKAGHPQSLKYPTWFSKFFNKDLENKTTVLDINLYRLLPSESFKLVSTDKNNEESMDEIIDIEVMENQINRFKNKKDINKKVIKK